MVPRGSSLVSPMHVSNPGIGFGSRHPRSLTSEDIKCDCLSGNLIFSSQTRVPFNDIMNAFENRNTQDSESNTLSNKGELCQNSSSEAAAKAECIHPSDAPERQCAGSDGEEYKEQATDAASCLCSELYDKGTPDLDVADWFERIDPGDERLRSLITSDINPQVEEWKKVVASHDGVGVLEMMDEVSRHSIFVCRLDASTFQQVLDFITHVLPKFVFKIISAVKLSDIVGCTKCVTISAIGVGGGKKKGKPTVFNKKRSSATIQDVDAKLTKCALRGLVACVDPFNAAAKGACNGGARNTGETLKYDVHVRVPVTVGTGRIGVCYISPTTAYDAVCLMASNSTYAADNTMAVMTSNNTPVVGINGITLPDAAASVEDLTWLTSSNAPALAGRICSAGAKLTYTGTTLNEGGTVVGYVSPVHSNVAVNPGGGTMTFGSLLALDDSRLLSPDSPPLVAFPVCADEVNFPDPQSASTNTYMAYPYSSNDNYINGFTWNYNGVDVGSPTMLIAIQGEPGNTYILDYVQHMELIGEKAVGATSGEADPEGFGHVYTTAAKVAKSLAEATYSRRGSSTKNIWSLARSTMMSQLRKAAKVGIPAAIDSVMIALA